MCFSGAMWWVTVFQLFDLTMLKNFISKLNQAHYQKSSYRWVGQLDRLGAVVAGNFATALRGSRVLHASDEEVLRDYCLNVSILIMAGTDGNDKIYRICDGQLGLCFNLKGASPAGGHIPDRNCAKMTHSSIGMPSL